jgi:uncharacterized membrane protein YdbT with pleckstrin-like domain
MRLHEGERLIHELHPEPAVVVVWLFTKCLLPALPVALLSFFACAVVGGALQIGVGPDREPPFGAALVIAAIVGAAVVVLCITYCVFLRTTYVYYVTDQRCVFHGGILRRVERSVPYHKVTDVETSRNILEQALGIATVKVFTPGTASNRRSPFGGTEAELTFVGLADGETPAATINEMLKRFRATGE